MGGEYEEKTTRLTSSVYCSSQLFLRIVKTSRSEKTSLASHINDGKVDMRALRYWKETSRTFLKRWVHPMRSFCSSSEIEGGMVWARACRVSSSLKLMMI